MYGTPSCAALRTQSGTGGTSSSSDVAFTSTKAGPLLLNTCSVREKAARKVYDLLGQLRSLKESYPDLILGLCGCVAQSEGEEAFRKAHHLDLVFGPRAVGRLPDLLAPSKHG